MKILSIIYDGGSRIPGARFAPTKYYQEAMLYDRKDSDIITINLGNQDLFSIDLESLSRTIAESKVQIALGGDHSVTYLLAKATVREGAYLIVLDAHLDYFKDFESVVKNWNFLSFLTDIFEKIIIPDMGNNKRDIEKIIIIGERNFESPSSFDNKIIILSMEEYWLNKSRVLKKLDSYIDESKDIYLSIDIDVLDPSVFDSVSYPIIGGFQMNDFLGIISKILCSDKVYFCDIVEYNPMVGSDNAHIFYQMIQFVKSKLRRI